VLEPEGVLFRMRRQNCPYTNYVVEVTDGKKKFVNPLKASKRKGRR
jgi:hypothetical protein